MQQTPYAFDEASPAYFKYMSFTHRMKSQLGYCILQTHSFRFQARRTEKEWVAYCRTHKIWIRYLDRKTAPENPNPVEESSSAESSSDESFSVELEAASRGGTPPLPVESSVSPVHTYTHTTLQVDEDDSDSEMEFMMPVELDEVAQTSVRLL